MSELSNLPPADQVRDEVKIRIEQVDTRDCRYYTTERVAFDYISSDSSVEPKEVTAKVFKITDPRITGELPSKVFFTDDGDMILTFYCSASLPNRARPFAGGPVYVFAFDAPRGCTVEYDGDVRLFIDQMYVPGRGIVYVVMFGQDQYDRVVLGSQTKKHNIPWELGMSIAASTVTEE